LENGGKLPLDGIRALEFTHAVMGPVAGLILADLGAEVIRIERAPEGDQTRRLKGFGSGYYTFFNRNKKSIAIDLKSQEGHKIILQLLGTVDILIENFGPGAMDRLGLGYEALRENNPRLIYCSLKGFLPGPYEKRPALDEVVQMMSGLAYMTGPPGQPLRAGASIVDIMGGTYGAMATLIALMERQTTGQGKLVKNGLFETAAFIMGQHMAYSAITQEDVPPMPARISAWAIYRIFATVDHKQVFIGITSDKQWERFCNVFGREDLLARENLSTNSQRIDASEWLLPELEQFFGDMTKTEIILKCDEAEIPFSPISHPEDLFNDPQLNEADSLVEVTLEDGRKTKLPRLPILIEGDDLGLRMEAPKIGEHTQNLLHDIGYTDDVIQRLVDTKVIVTDGDFD
jgi:crotonobetainyl-CoA:carnitine CoA-transferase CaiB-like acyl-CoA transferase